MSKAYENAGVNLEAGYQSVELIKKHVAKTKNLGVQGNIGAFGAMFDLGAYNYKHPILVSGTDGVGTKLKIAIDFDKHDTIGIDVVAMCVNDIITTGARPLYFLDYIATSKVIPEQIEQIVKGVSEGCIQSEAALVGGETAEMPDMYHDGDYDIAGYTTGVVEKDQIIDGSKVSTGNVIIGLPSSGIHSNGYSLVRKILFKDNNLALTDYIDELNDTLGNVLLEPTRIYVKPVLKVIEECQINGIAHITGGGFIENIPRILKDNQQAKITKGSWPILPVFNYLEKLGNIEHNEMFNVFNMGIGMILVVDQSECDNVMSKLEEIGESAYIIGEIQSGEGVVVE